MVTKDFADQTDVTDITREELNFTFNQAQAQGICLICWDVSVFV